VGIVIFLLPIFLYFWGGVVLTKRVCDYIQRRTQATASYAIWSLIGCLGTQAVMVLISVALVQVLVAIIFEELPEMNGIDLKEWMGILEPIFFFGTIFWAANFVRYWRTRDRGSD
jgi:hypothetical protein